MRFAGQRQDEHQFLSDLRKVNHDSTAASSPSIRSFGAEKGGEVGNAVFFLAMRLKLKLEFHLYEWWWPSTFLWMKFSLVHTRSQPANESCLVAIRSSLIKSCLHLTVVDWRIDSISFDRTAAPLRYKIFQLLEWKHRPQHISLLLWRIYSPNRIRISSYLLELCKLGA